MHRKREQVIVMSCPQMEGMARSVVNKFQYHSSPVQYSLINWGEFPDKFPNLSVEAEMIRNNHVWFISSLDNPIELFRQLSVLCAIPRLGAYTLNIVLPFYPTGTMDRVKNPGDIVTAKTLARMFDAIPTDSCRTRIFIFDIHDPREEYYFSNRIVTFMSSLIPTMTNIFSDWSIAFPDEGAQKRFGLMLERFPRIVCQKIRQDNQRIISIKEGDVEGRDILIVDDLTRTGGTLIECAKALQDAKAKTISLVVPHAAFNNKAAVRKLINAHNRGIFNRLYTTDSCPLSVSLVKDLDFVFITPIADTIKDIIIREEF